MSFPNPKYFGDIFHNIEGKFIIFRLKLKLLFHQWCVCQHRRAVIELKSQLSNMSNVQKSDLFENYQASLQRTGKESKDNYMRYHSHCIKEIFGDEKRNLLLKEMTHCPEHCHYDANQPQKEVETIEIQRKHILEHPSLSCENSDFASYYKNAQHSFKENVATTISREHDILKTLQKYSYNAADFKTEKAGTPPKPRILNDSTNISMGLGLVRDKFPFETNIDNGGTKEITKTDNTNNTNQQIFPGKFPFGSENDGLHTNAHQKTLRIFNCQKCTKSFRHKSSLKQHCISIHEQSKYKCPICQKEFNRISSLNTHKSIHDEEKKFKCGHCGKAFHQKGNLKHHIFTHVSIRPYVCTRCDKSFHQPSNLRTHMCVYDVMDPLPLTVILHEGEELGDQNILLDFSSPQESRNCQSNGLMQGFCEMNRAKHNPIHVKSSSSVEFDAISYCFNCNLGFTHKVESDRLEYESGGLCPSCGLTLYTRVIPKCEEDFSAGKIIDDKYQKLQTFPNLHKQNMV